MTAGYSDRFRRNIRVTYHAKQRMKERSITQNTLIDLIEKGDAIHKDDRRLWLSKFYPDRDDNLICAAVVLDDEVIVKTVMRRWQLIT